MKLPPLALAVIFGVPPAAADTTPYAVAPALFDHTRPNDLGLKPAPDLHTYAIFRAGEGTDHYVNGVVAIVFKNKLYAQWQSSAQDEDAPDTHMVYAVSKDGAHWLAPKALTTAASQMSTSGGWWTNGNTLVAFLNVWNANFHTGGVTFARTSKDGVHWSALTPVADARGNQVQGVIEQDPHALPDGRIITAFHLQPGLIATPYYTDDREGLTGWTAGSMDHLPHEGGESRELEPSWFRRADGCLVMVFRDQQSTFRQLASESCDRGEHWSTPVLTTMPDSRAKQGAGNLPDGTAFLVNAPSGNKLRSPLVVSLSKNGDVFDRALLLQAGPPPAVRFPGKFKRAGYHYPKSVLFKDSLCVTYASAKEDALISCFRIR